MTNSAARIPYQEDSINDRVADAFDKVVIALAGILAMVTIFAVA